MVAFHISPQSWETLAGDRNRWRASLSYGCSLSATSCTEKHGEELIVVNDCISQFYFRSSITPQGRIQGGEEIGAIQGGEEIGAIAPLKPTKVTLFTTIFYNLENNIHDIRPFRRLLFCYNSFVKHTFSLLQ